jgi:hypothetical protein
LESPHIANRSPVVGDSTKALTDRARREGLAQFVVGSGNSPHAIADGLGVFFSEAGNRRSHSLTILISAPASETKRGAYPSYEPPDASIPGIDCRATRLVTDRRAVR